MSFQPIATGGKCALLLQLKQFFKNANVFDGDGDRKLVTVDFGLTQREEWVFDDMQIIILPFLHYVQVTKEITLFVESYTLLRVKHFGKSDEIKLIFTQYLAEHGTIVTSTIGPFQDMEMFVKEL